MAVQEEEAKKKKDLNLSKSSMTPSQREATEQAEQLQKALEPIVGQLTDVGDELVMQLAPGQFYKISKCDGAEYGSEEEDEDEV